jgi:hypothetical protein
MDKAISPWKKGLNRIHQWIKSFVFQDFCPKITVFFTCIYFNSIFNSMRTTILRLTVYTENILVRQLLCYLSSGLLVGSWIPRVTVLGDKRGLVRGPLGTAKEENIGLPKSVLRPASCYKRLTTPECSLAFLSRDVVSYSHIQHLLPVIFWGGGSLPKHVPYCLDFHYLKLWAK